MMFEFHMDDFTSGQVSGWVRFAGREDVRLELTVNSSDVLNVTAARHRPDLFSAGIGTGNYGYCFNLPNLLHNGDVISVREPESDTVLFTGPYQGQGDRGLQCAHDLRASLVQPDLAYWQSLVSDMDAQGCTIGGSLMIPSGEAISNLAIYDIDTGETYAPNAHLTTETERDRLWFFDGDVYDLALRVPLKETHRRLAVLPKGRRTPADFLNYIVIPGTQDVSTFRFPGSERARRVAGGADTVPLFASGGMTQAFQIAQLAENMTTLPKASRVLDWGCGPGRVVQFLAKLQPDWRFTGADIDVVNLQWAREQLSTIADFVQLDLMPPMPFADATFDLVYGLSVITHLRKDAQQAWIRELSRVTRPGGYVILTYMGLWAALQCGRGAAVHPVYENIHDHGISDDISDPALGEDLSQYYRATFNHPEELGIVLRNYFEIVSHHPRSLCFQDAFVLRKI